MEKKFVNIRNSDELQKDLHEAREVLGIDHRIHGADPETVRQSLRFVIELNHLLWERFNTDYGTLSKDFIRRKLCPSSR